MDRFLCPTHIALHLTAPMERTVTSFNHLHDLRVEPPAAAHQVATVHPNGRVVALTAMGALDAQTRVPLAKHRRWLVVHQILKTAKTNP